MPRTVPVAPLSIPALLALEFAADRGLLMVMASGSRGSSPTWEFMRTPTPDNQRPGRVRGEGVPHVEAATANALAARSCIQGGTRNDLDRSLGIEPGQVASAADPVAWAKRSPLSWYETPYTVTDAGRMALEAGRARLAGWRAAEAGRAAAPPEYLAVGRGRNPGVGALCRIVSRTPRRVYVEVVDGGGVRDATVAVTDSTRNGASIAYVAVEDVLVDGIDPEDWRRLAAATRDRDGRVARDAGRYEERIKAIRDEQRAAAAQADSEYEDTLREVLGAGAPRP